jgi:hypothetical protein
VEGCKSDEHAWLFADSGGNEVIDLFHLRRGRRDRVDHVLVDTGPLPDIKERIKRTVISHFDIIERSDAFGSPQSYPGRKYVGMAINDLRHIPHLTG